MAELVKAKRLDLGGTTPDEARAAIKALFDNEPGAISKVYTGLAHKVWTLLIERRLDTEIRDWHALLLGVRASVRIRDDKIAERFAALADLVRESISLSETSPIRDAARRPQARRILELLAETENYVARRHLLRALGLKNANLSNVLTQLVAFSLIERREKGKEAEFRITALGREMADLGTPDAATLQVSQALLKARAMLAADLARDKKQEEKKTESQSAAKRYVLEPVLDVPDRRETSGTSTHVSEDNVVSFRFSTSRRLSGAVVTSSRGGSWQTHKRSPIRTHF